MKLLSFLFVCSLGLQSLAQQLPSPKRLRTDWLLQLPEKGNANSKINQIKSKTPVFSWEVDPAVHGISAYQLLLSTSPQVIQKQQALVWDSKKKISTALHTKYEGPALVQGMQYYWLVKIWDGKGASSSYSYPYPFVYNADLNKDTVSHYPLQKQYERPQVTYRTGTSYFMDFGKDGYAQLQLELQSPNEDSITLEVGEMSEDGKKVKEIKGGNIRYLKMTLPVSKGKQLYNVPWPANEKRDKAKAILMPAETGQVYPFRYVSVHSNSGKVVLMGSQRYLVHYPFDESASYFKSSDTVLNKVWDLCSYSMKATSFCGYYVDGDRERIPYEGDAIINQLSQYAVDAEYSMARRTMAYLLYHPTWPTEWNLQNPILAWNDYEYTGETSFIKKYESMLKLKTLSALADSSGLISTTTGKQTSEFLKDIYYKTFDQKDVLRDIVDWPRNGEIGKEKQYGGETDGYEFNDFNAVVNAFYYRSLVLMGKMMAAIGNKQEASAYAQQAAKVYASYQLVFVDGKTGLVKDGNLTKHHSLHANMFALCFGLVEEQHKRAVLDFIKTRKMACSVYGAQFLLEALYENGEADYAQSLLTSTSERSWYNMIRVGSTITLEAWDKLYKPNTDWNHAWGAAPANIIVRHLMGVQPLDPGFGRILIKPHVGGLNFAQLKTPTIKGPVWVDFKRSETGFVYKLELPGASLTKFVLPKPGADATLLLDGKKWDSKSSSNIWEIENLLPGKHQIEVKTGRIKDYNILDFGAKPDGQTLNTQSIQKAIDKAAEEGGGRVLVPAGKFLTGTLELKSNIELHVEAGGYLLGSESYFDYDMKDLHSLLKARAQHHISITGKGVIDGQGRQYIKNLFELLKAGKVQDREWKVKRPTGDTRYHIIQFVDCSDISYKNITLKNPTDWVQKLERCQRITIDSVTVDAVAYWNNDGFDFNNCKEVRITNCNLNCSDDAICLKSEDKEGICENFYIANCTLRSSASALKFGTASYGGFRNIVVRNLTVYDTYRSAIALEAVDGGFIDKVDIRGVKARNTGNAIFIRLAHRNKDARYSTLQNVYIANVDAQIPAGKPDKGYEIEAPVLRYPIGYKPIPGKIESISPQNHSGLDQNVILYPHNVFPSSIAGLPGHPVKNVVLENIRIRYAGGADKNKAYMPLDSLNLITEAENAYPEFSMFGELPAWGFFIRHVEGLTFKNVHLSVDKPDFREPLVFDDAKNVKKIKLQID